VVLTVAIFVTNVLLHRSLLDSALFSLAIAVGITPQLLPAVVSTSLATGSRQLARRKVLVKRLVCIEDLATWTSLDHRQDRHPHEGTSATAPPSTPTAKTRPRSSSTGCWPPRNTDKPAATPWTRRCGKDPAHADQHRPADRDGALRPRAAHDLRTRRHTRRHPADRRQRRARISPGRCTDVPDAAEATLQAQFAAGSRVVAVASRPAPHATTLAATDEHDLHLDGLLIFLDPPKAGAADSLRRLAGLGITVKIATGDNAVVAEKVCADLGLMVARLPDPDRGRQTRLFRRPRRPAASAPPT